MTDQNLAFYFQKFTITLTHGSVQYTTAGILPSNSVLNRVAFLTVSGTLFPQDTDTYTLVFDFTEVQSGRNISLEGPIDGMVTFCKKTFDATEVLRYTYENRILTIHLQVPRMVRRKPQHFFMNIQINDRQLV